MLRFLRRGIYILTSVIGILAFLLPFFSPPVDPTSHNPAQYLDSPLLLALIGGLCLVALLLETQVEGAMDAKFVALLGILVSINAVLSFLETAIPGPGGFSPTFFLIILTGYIFGARFGFLMGALTLFTSALITGGIGPWLPYQMLSAGWVGLSSALIKRITSIRHVSHPRMEIIVLAIWGMLWGLLFGAIMNLWFWPYGGGAAEQSYAVGLSLSQALRRYVVFYTATSLIWDSARGIGTAALILLLGTPTLKTLRRFHKRFAFSVIEQNQEKVT